MVFTSKWTIFSPGIQWEGSLDSWKSVLYEKIEKYIRISKFLKFLDFWILDSAWSLTHDCTFLVMESLRHNPCEVTHKISARLSHKYCIYQGGAESAPPLTQMCSWDPVTIRVKNALVLLFNWKMTCVSQAVNASARWKIALLSINNCWRKGK